MTLEELRKKYKEKILAIANKNGVENVRVFGSIVYGNHKINSDIDFLVHPRKGTGLWELGSLYYELNNLLQRKIDVVPDNAEIFYPAILEDAIPL